MIEIKNLRKEKPVRRYDMRVDRSSPVGNPYRIEDIRYLEDELKRDYVCDRYEKEFNRLRQITFFEAYLQSLVRIYRRHGRLRLFCWCAPKRCHAETIKSYIERNQS
jgi:hypothetical protein